MEPFGVACAVVSLAVESIHCARSALTHLHQQEWRTIQENLTDTHRLLEQAQLSLGELEKQNLFDISGEEKNDPDRHMTRDVTRLQECLCPTCGTSYHERKSADSLKRHLLQWDQGNCGHSLAKAKRTFGVWAKMLAVEVSKGRSSSKMLALPEIVASKNCEVKDIGPVDTMLEKLLTRIRSAGRCKGEDLHRGHGWRRHSSTSCKVSAAQAVRLAGGMFMLYPACMLVMGNFAAENVSFRNRNSWVTGILRQRQDAEIVQAHSAEVMQTTAVTRTLANASQGASMAQIVPGCVMEPSAPLFLVASMTWAFLEWAHYQSNVEDRYQMAILGVISMIGFLPALGCAENMLAVAVCTVPWAMHFGLLISHVLHRVSRVDNVVQTCH